MLSFMTTTMPLPLLSLIGWSVVPDFATKRLINILHRFAIIPTPKSQATYSKQYALTFAFVVLTYLSYNLFDSARSMPPNFYQILSVHPSVDDSGLKVAFRQFAKKNHPDRPGVGKDGEELFIMVRDVYEALKDPVVRFAYDRFGPEVLAWSQEYSTTRDYIQHGLIRSSGYHIFMGAALVFWSFVGSSGPDAVSFWRYVLYATFFFAEISLILSPSPSPVLPSTSGVSELLNTYTTHTPLHTLFPQRLIHQHILFLHQLFVFLSIALTRVFPVILAAFSPDESLSTAVHQELLKSVSQLAAVAHRESSIILSNILHSVASPAEFASSPSATDGKQAPPHEDVSSLARPRPFVPPPGIFDFPDPRTTNPATGLPMHSGKETQDNDQHRDHPLVKLRREMEELIIENNIKKEDGPLRSAWEAAIRRGRGGVKSAMNFWEAPVNDGYSVDEVDNDDDDASGDEGEGADSSTASDEGNEISVDEDVSGQREKEQTAPDSQNLASPRRNDGARASH